MKNTSFANCCQHDLNKDLILVISIWVASEGHRRLVHVFPDLVREWWDKWELQGLVFISLVSQILLTLLGNRRKYGTRDVIKSIVWCAYLLADKVPTVALSVISGKLRDYIYKNGEQIENPQLIALWAPFFLMHIGGPDTITAYALYDNELWLRHLVGLVSQTLLSVYIIFLSWRGTSWLSCLSVPMLIIGFVKYGERTWCLYSASISYCRDSRLSSAISENEQVSNEERLKGFIWLKGFMGLFVSLFSDMVLGTKDIVAYIKKFRSMNYSRAFDLMDFQHGFSYDVMYTKASVTHTIWGCISRLITTLAIVVMFILFIVFSTEHDKYLGVDRIISYMLFVAAVISEIFSIISLIISSEWTIEILRQIMGESGNSFLSTIIKWLEQRNSKKRKWWNSIAQCNFLTLLCHENNKVKVSRDSLSIMKLDKLLNITRWPVSPDLKRMLFDNIKKESTESTQTQIQPGSRYRELVKAQGLHTQRVTIENLEFHQSILLWHIVTDVCYYCDAKRDFHGNTIHSTESKKLSDYMFYLLMKRRYMLPVGTGLLSLHDTLVEATKYFKKKNVLTCSSNVGEACNTLLQHITEDTEYATTHSIDRSVFHYAFMAAHEFLTRHDMNQIWEFLTELWIEIIKYGAVRCKVDSHAQELINGGEFISHVWGLQASLGLLEQFQLTQNVYKDEFNDQDEILSTRP